MRISDWSSDVCSSDLGLLSLAYVAVQVVQIFEYVMPAGQFKIVHVGGAALLICLYAAGSAKSLASRWVHFALAAVAAGIIGYVFGQPDLLTSKRAFLPTDMAYNGRQSWGGRRRQDVL